MRTVLAAGTVGAAALTAGVLAGRDYQRWCDLGVGGIPNTPRGWLRVTRLRARKQEARNPAVYRPLQGQAGDGQWLTDLPPRTGERPVVAPYPVPHRQSTQPGTVQGRAAALARFDVRAAADPTLVTYRRSFFETHHDAITVQDLSQAPDITRAAHGEAAHIHPSDGSMHMIFSPTDAITVLQAGWGERHPLAGIYPNMPVTYLLIYSPRDEQEAEVAGTLLEAAVSYAVGHPGDPT